MYESHNNEPDWQADAYFDNLEEERLEEERLEEERLRKKRSIEQINQKTNDSPEPFGKFGERVTMIFLRFFVGTIGSLLVTQLLSTSSKFLQNLAGYSLLGFIVLWVIKGYSADKARQGE